MKRHHKRRLIAVSKVKVVSSTLTTFTEAAFFKRVSRDLEQVVDGATISRVHFGCLVNVDEGYKFLRLWLDCREASWRQRRS